MTTIDAAQRIYKSQRRHAAMGPSPCRSRLLRQIIEAATAAMTALRWARTVAATDPVAWSSQWDDLDSCPVYRPVPPSAVEEAGDDDRYYWLVPVVSRRHGRWLPLPWWGDRAAVVVSTAASDDWGKGGPPVYTAAEAVAIERL